jgi:uncharacterized membrane protein YcaP (DUF421 family)
MDTVNLPSWLDIIIRSFAMLIILFFLAKLLGKKQVSQLTLFEYVVGITFGSIAAEISTGLERNLVQGLLSLFVWTLVPFGITMISLKNKKFRDFIEGKPTVVIKDGKIQEDNLTKEKYSIDDLMELLRQKNAFNIADVEFAILEASGDLNVLLKREKQPLTPKDIHLRVAGEKEPHTVILEGKILDEPLGLTGYNRAWLLTELEKLNVSLANVFIGQVDSYGKLSVDIYDDKIQLPQSQEKSLLLATLKKCQADLELFSIATQSVSAKEMYERNAERLTQMLRKAGPYLKE